MIKSQMKVNAPLWLTVYFCILEFASASVFSGVKRLLGDEDGLGLLRRWLRGSAWQPGLVVCSALHSGLSLTVFAIRKKKKKKLSM